MFKAPPILAVIAGLPQYSKEELKILKNKINAYITDGREQRQALEDSDWLLRGILVELRARGEIINDRYTIRSSQSYRNFETKSVDVREIIERLMPKNLTAVEYLAVGEFCGQELVRYLVKIGRPINKDEVLNNVHLTIRAINQSFPGYIECGLLGGVITRMLNKTEGVGFDQDK